MTRIQKDTRYSTTHRQRGISLVIVMIFLVILSLLGISAMQSSTLSSRIARNEADRNLAFQAAEAALRDGELDVRNQRFDRSKCVAGALGCRVNPMQGKTRFDVACTEGRCVFQDNVSPWETAAKWTGTGAGSGVVYGTYTGAANIPLVATQPRYILEALPIADSPPTYRITAVGFGASRPTVVGGNSTTQVMLQIVVRVKTQL